MLDERDVDFGMKHAYKHGTQTLIGGFMTSKNSAIATAQASKKSETKSATQRAPAQADKHGKDGTKESADEGRGRSVSSGTSSLIMQLVGSVVGDNLQDTISSVKSKVSEQMASHGADYLDSAKAHLIEATEKIVAWGKKHPVQAVAAATALVGVSAFLYATLRSKEASDASSR